MTALLSVSGLTVRGGRTLVEDVSFEVAAGARTGLIGESGSGKSLTALAVTGLLPPGLTATGSAVLDPTASAPVSAALDPTGSAPSSTVLDPTGSGRGGAAIDMITASERLRIRARGGIAAVVFQEPLTALDPLMRAGKQIAEPLRRWRGLRGAALGTAVTEALDEVRLPASVAASFPHELSGGQRQRVAIAMALACRPRLLIADEPTTALDVTVQAEILDLLDGLVRDRGMALLFITHDLPVAARIADTLLVLRDGRVVEHGPTASVIGSPAHEYTRTLVAGARRFDAALDTPVRQAGDPARLDPAGTDSTRPGPAGPDAARPGPAAPDATGPGPAAPDTASPGPAAPDAVFGGGIGKFDDGRSHD